MGVVLAATASPAVSPTPAANQPVDTSEFFAALVALVIALGLSVVLILRMRAARA